MSKRDPDKLLIPGAIIQGEVEIQGKQVPVAVVVGKQTTSISIDRHLAHVSLSLQRELDPEFIANDLVAIRESIRYKTLIFTDFPCLKVDEAAYFATLPPEIATIEDIPTRTLGILERLQQDKHIIK